MKVKVPRAPGPIDDIYFVNIVYFVQLSLMDKKKIRTISTKYLENVLSLMCYDRKRIAIRAADFGEAPFALIMPHANHI